MSDSQAPLTLETAVRIAGTVRHDLNNSLMAMMGHLEVLERRPGLSAEAHAQIETLMDLARRMRDQVAQLNALHRP